MTRQIFIGGRWQDAQATASFDVANPATLEYLGSVAECGEADLQSAVDAATGASPSWAGYAHGARVAHLVEVGRAIGDCQDVLARVLTEESGSPLCESHECIHTVAGRFAASGAGAADEHCEFGTPMLRELGDFPLLRMMSHLATVLAAGYTVCYHAAASHSLTSLRLAQCFAGLPPGVFNVVTGGEATGALLAGRSGIASVAMPPAPLQVSVVLQGADIELAVAGVAWSRLRHSGQDRRAWPPVYVERPLAASFADRLHEYVAFLEVGDPRRSDTDLGPLITHAAARRVEEQVAHAVKDGARLKLGGRGFRPWGLKGHFFQPTILTDVRCGSLASREIGGPVLALAPVEDLDEALRCAADHGGECTISIYGELPAAIGHARREAPYLESVVRREATWFPYRDRPVRPASA